MQRGTHLIFMDIDKPYTLEDYKAAVAERLPDEELLKETTLVLPKADSPMIRWQQWKNLAGEIRFRLRQLEDHHPELKTP